MKNLIIKILLFFISIFLSHIEFSYAEEFPKRIVSLSPNTTEIIYGIGAWDRVVGVTLYSDFPPEAKDLPNVGGWVDPNLEAILALKPDLVVMMSVQDGMFGDKIRKLGLKTLSAEGNDSIDGILDSIMKIGESLGKESESSTLVKSLKSALDEIREKTKSLPRRSVLLVVGKNPGTLEDIYAMGRASYVNEVMVIAGGVNVVENEAIAMKVSKEAILSLDPDVIIEVNHEKIDKKKEIIKTWGLLKELSAVKNGEVYVVSSTALLHPSQRIIEGARALTEILHPELFEQYGASVQPSSPEDMKKAD